MNLVACPKCGFDQDGQQEQCLRCGLIFAKYHKRQETLREAPPLPDTLPFEPGAGSFVDEGRREFRLRLWAVPVALLLFSLLVASPLKHLMRIFLSMWVHEAGHAVTAWFCGFGAFPGPWRTPVSEDRITSVTVLLAGTLIYWGYRGWREGKLTWSASAASLLLLQIVCSMLSESKANALIIFGGDAGCLVLGTLLMATFYAPRESVLYHGGLRWGFLPIGAAAYLDAFATWWGARSDVGQIPFGENEGVGSSDPTRLMDDFGWTIQNLVDRHLAVALTCLLLLTAVYLVGLYRERNRRGA